MPTGITSVSNAFTINSTTAGTQSGSSIVFLAGSGGMPGVFGVAFEGDAEVGANIDIYYREVTLTGGFASAQQTLVTNPGQDIGPELVQLAGGEVVLAFWENPVDFGDAESTALFGTGAGVTTRAGFDTTQVTLASPYEASGTISALVALPGGGFAMAASMFAGSDRSQATVTVYDADGMALRNTDRVVDGAYRSAAQGMALLPDGRVLTVIGTDITDVSEERVQLQAYTAGGLPSGGVITQSFPDEYVLFTDLTSLGDGRVLQSYVTQNFDTGASALGVAARIIAPTGEVLATLGQLHDDPSMQHLLPRIAATPDGGFVVAWLSYPASGSLADGSLMLRRFDIDGQPVGEAVTVAEETTGEYQVAVAPTGEVLVTWTFEVGGSGDYDVQGRTYALDDLGIPGETRTGTIGNDRLLGTGDDDTLLGDVGADYLDGGAGHDVMQGGLGNDFYIVDSLGDQIVGEIAFSAGGGIDTVRTFVSYVQPENIELVRLGNIDDFERLSAVGNDAPGTLVGNAGGNVLIGRGGNDQLNGNGGWDVLVGGVGRDTLVGGAGRDTFIYNSISESRVGIAERDVINGFDRGGDRIDLSAMDANLGGPGDAAFGFIGTARFSGTAGELRLQGLGGPNAVIVEGDLRGDGVADFQIFVNLTTVLGAGDFIL